MLFASLDQDRTKVRPAACILVQNTEELANDYMRRKHTKENINMLDIMLGKKMNVCPKTVEQIMTFKTFYGFGEVEF